MSQQSVDARLDDRATSFGQGGEHVRELLQLGGLLRGHRRALGFGVDLRVGSEREHEVALDLGLVVPARQESPPPSLGLVHVGIHPVFEDGEVLDPLRAGAHEGLTDVAEAGSFGKAAGIVGVEGGLDDLFDGEDGLIDRRTGRVFLGGDHRALDLFGFCHDDLHQLDGPVFDGIVLSPGTQFISRSLDRQSGEPKKTLGHLCLYTAAGPKPSPDDVLRESVGTRSALFDGDDAQIGRLTHSINLGVGDLGMPEELGLDAEQGLHEPHAQGREVRVDEEGSEAHVPVGHGLVRAHEREGVDRRGALPNFQDAAHNIGAKFLDQELLGIPGLFELDERDDAGAHVWRVVSRDRHSLEVVDHEEPLDVLARFQHPG